MSINRHNYEEFFVMYADGELNEALRLEVDAFVARHPDLAEELQLMKDMKLDATDMPAMPGKASLMKPLMWDAEALTPEQTQLLNWLDGHAPDDMAMQLAHNTQMQAEWQQLQNTRLPHTPQPMPQSWRMLHTQPWPADGLTPDQELMASAVDQPELESRLQPLLQEPLWQKEWYLLQQTRLQATAETMPAKESLYRHAPVVGMVAWRKHLVRAVAAAAIMAGAGWFVFSGPDSSVPTSQPDTRTVVAVETPAPKNNTPATNLPEAANQSAIAAIAASPAASPVASNLQQAGQKPPAQTTAANNSTANMQTLIAANRLTAEEETELQLARLQGATASPTTKAVETNTGQPSIDLAKANPDVQATVTYAVYRPELEQEAEEEKFVRIAGAKINKQKLRGVFRTVSRTVSRNFEKSDLNEDLKQATSSLR